MKLSDSLLDRPDDRLTIAAAARDGTLKVAIGACLVLTAFCVVHANAIAHGLTQSWLALATDGSGAVIAAAVAIVLRRGAPTIERSELGAFAVAIVVAAVATLTANLYQDARELGYIAFTPLALAAVCVRRGRWLAVTAIVYADALVAAWVLPSGAAGGGMGTGGDEMRAVFTMSASVVIAIAIHAGRRSGFLSMLAARRAERERHAELAAAARRERELSDQLRHVQKLDAIGTLAGGIAHDINNVLAAILGVAELAREDAPDESQIHEELGEIMTAAERGAQLTRNLLGFARRGKHRHERVVLADAVDEVVALLARTAPRQIRFERDAGPDVASAAVMGDPSQLTQIVMNLSLNAIDAMPGGGTLAIGVHAVELAADERAVLAAGSYLRLTVRDTGTGMCAQTLEHAFEPFYSTKTQTSRSGSGLGLAMVYGTVRDHLGEVALESELGVGTTATIFLPRAPSVGGRVSTLASGRSHRATPPMPVVLTARPVLVVDDEELVRHVCVRLLHGQAVSTRVADNGRTGLELFRAEPASFSMVLLDLAMPELTGAECFRAIRAIAPAMPIVVMSGFPKDQCVDDLLAMGHAAFLAKPFVRRSLLDAVTQVAR